MPRTRRHGINTVGDLIAALESFDSESNIVMQVQHRHPIFARISDVFMSEEEDGSGEIVVIDYGVEGYSPEQVLKGD